MPILRGQVRVGEGPMSQGQVVLHRVAPDSSGEIDSVRVEPDGSFRFRLPHLPDHGGRSEIFFASVRHRGLLYFGPAITEPIQLDSLYMIQAYDTLSVPPGGAELPLSARNVFLEKEEEEGWTATDVVEVRQTGDRTLYSPRNGVVWSYPLPASARDFQVGQSDLAPESVRFQDGRMEVLAPIPPGERVFLVRYRIPSDDFVLPLPGRTDVVEVLVREPGPEAEFPPLVRGQPVELEAGNVFRRYVAEDLQNTEIRASLTSGSWQFRGEWLALLLAALLAAAGVLAYRIRQRGAAPVAGTEAEEGEARPPPSASPSRRDLILAVARLDEEFSRKSHPSRQERVRYETQREKLLARIQRSS